MTKQNNTVLGILAHVDAGKTTLCEAMLFLSGKLNRQGRVDHGDTLLDSHALERERGITIFAKQAVTRLGDGALTLLDTPGHADFSAEAERTLRVLDCAVLVISGTDGVQAHTETLWRLLERYGVPCLVFVSKMDLPGPGREALLRELNERLSGRCVDFTQGEEAWQEAAALCDEEAIERWLEAGAFSDEELRALIAGRRLFPCFFGSGLKAEGVGAFLEALRRFAPRRDFGPDFSARVFKISRDEKGRRLTWLRVTGGSLRVRQKLVYAGAAGESFEEKVTELRVYSGPRYETAEELGAGWVCAAVGLSATRPGQGLGAEADAEAPVLEPVMSWRVVPEAGTDPMLLLPKLMQLDQEDPQLHVLWDERHGEISVQLMGRIRGEIFRRQVKDRFDADVTLEQGRILYRETIRAAVEGVGHFEPLRHYAEVHLILEPLPPGSGLSYDSSCPEDALDRNWQRLILGQLAEKQHLGVLTGSPVTDLRISLAAGRAHLKHTEGGDFRQAAWRAVRQGLMQAESVLLEPWYAFVLEVPAEQIGRAISDVRAMDGSFTSPQEHGELLRLEGEAPARKLAGYPEELAAWSHGRGRLSLSPCGWRPCAEQDRIVAEIGYDPERDIDNPADSVFCAHGAGVNIRWDQVKDYMHLESVLRPKPAEAVQSPAARFRGMSIDDRELEAIMEREFGPIRRRSYTARQLNAASDPDPAPEASKKLLIVDGYNLIFAWEELRSLAAERLDLARERLVDLLSGYAAYTGTETVLVFDGFRTPGNPGERTQDHGVSVVYTKDGETADAWIERFCDGIGKNYAVRVVTSDNLIRLSALRSGVLRCSSAEFSAELEDVLAEIAKLLEKSNALAHLTRLNDGKI